MGELNQPVVVIGILGVFIIALKHIFDFVKSITEKKNGNGTTSGGVNQSNLQEFRQYHMEAAKIQTRTVLILEDLAMVGRDRADRLEDMHKETQSKLLQIERMVEHMKVRR